MKKEYDFSRAEKGKFHVTHEDIHVPIYLDDSVREFYLQAARERNIDVTRLINTVLKKEIEIQKEIGKL